MYTQLSTSKLELLKSENFIQLAIFAFFSFAFFSFGLITLSTTTASAQLLVDHQADLAPGKYDLNAAIVLNEVEYEKNLEVDRSIIGGAFGFGAFEAADLYAELGYIAEAEVDGNRDDGDGIIVGVGGRGTMFRQGTFSLRGATGFRFISEDYGSSVDGEFYEIYGLVTGRSQVNKDFGVFGGIDLIPLSEGEIDARNGKADTDRDDPIGLRFGADYQLNNSATIIGELNLLSDHGFTFRVNFPLN